MDWLSDESFDETRCTDKGLWLLLPLPSHSVDVDEEEDVVVDGIGVGFTAVLSRSLLAELGRIEVFSVLVTMFSLFTEFGLT